MGLPRSAQPVRGVYGRLNAIFTTTATNKNVIMGTCLRESSRRHVHVQRKRPAKALHIKRLPCSLVLKIPPRRTFSAMCSLCTKLTVKTLNLRAENCNIKCIEEKSVFLILFSFSLVSKLYYWPYLEQKCNDNHKCHRTNFLLFHMTRKSTSRI